MYLIRNYSYKNDRIIELPKLNVVVRFQAKQELAITSDVEIAKALVEVEDLHVVRKQSSANTTIPLLDITRKEQPSIPVTILQPVVLNPGKPAQLVLPDLNNNLMPLSSPEVEKFLREPVALKTFDNVEEFKNIPPAPIVEAPPVVINSVEIPVEEKKIEEVVTAVINKDDNSLPICGCGCGKHTKGGKYLPGHHLRKKQDKVS